MLFAILAKLQYWIYLSAEQPKVCTGCFYTGTPLKNSKYKKLIQARLGVSRPIYVNVDSPNLGFPYVNFFGGYQ